MTSGRNRVDVEFRLESIVQIGDPVIIYDGDSARVIGSVVDVTGNPTKENLPVYTQSAKVDFFSSAPVPQEGDFLSYHSTPESMEWMVQMMLPPETRNAIGNLIVNAYRENHSEIAKLLQPVMLKSVRDAADVVKEEFNQSITRRADQIRSLGERYQIEIVEQQLIPLIQDEIWPIVEEESTPLSMEIGEQIWEEASVWRFGWRLLYDRSPLPERSLVKQEFQRFMEQHGMPVIQSRLSEMLTVQQKILQRVSENEKVQTVFAEGSQKVLRDPEFQKLAGDILRDVFVDNTRLAEAFEKNWNSEEAVAAMEITNQRLEPTVTRIGQTLFGAPDTSITPEFSRVLRNRILYKDNRWLVLHLKEDRDPNLENPEAVTLSVVPGETGTENPFHVPKRSSN